MCVCYMSTNIQTVYLSLILKHPIFDLVQTIIKDQ